MHNCSFCRHGFSCKQSIHIHSEERCFVLRACVDILKKLRPFAEIAENNNYLPKVWSLGVTPVCMLRLPFFKTLDIKLTMTAVNVSAIRKHSYMHTEDQFSVLSHKVWLLNVIVKLSSSEDCENNCSYILAQCL